MNTPMKNKPILFPARGTKDTNGHGANAFSFGPNLNEGIVQNLSQVFNETVSSSRAFFEKATSSAGENMKTVSELLLAFQIGVTQLNEKLIANATANTEAFLTAAKDMSTAHRVEDLARLQNDFFQKHLHTTTDQSKELFQLSNQILHKILEAVLFAATRMMGAPFQFKDRLKKH